VNTWEPFYTDIDRALLLQQIDLAADLGVDAYQVDDGWFDCMGDWNDDLSKFPNGLGEIADLCRARGLRFGLWMSVATVHADSHVARNHPAWLSRAPDGSPQCHSDPRKPVMCLASPYFDFILDKIDRVIARLGVELLKLDLTAVRNPYTPGRNHGCWASAHAHHPGNDSHARMMERLFDLVRELKRRHPSCLIDLSYELYGVMDGHDLALTQVADQNWFSNIASPNEISLRREIYQRGRVTRPWTLNFGGTHLDHPHAPHYGLFSTLTSHALFWGDLSRLDAETRAHYRRWFAWLKAQRARGDFYRDYHVSGVFPVPDGASSRDYRHAIPAQRYGVEPRGVHPPAFNPESQQLGEFWDGVARLDEHGAGPVFLFRPAASPASTFQLRVPWVSPRARYRVSDLTAGCELGEFGGAELAGRGLPVTIDQPLRAKVILLENAPTY
jgi:alpha-galactosidase